MIRPPPAHFVRRLPYSGNASRFPSYRVNRCLNPVPESPFQFLYSTHEQRRKTPLLRY